MIVTFCNCVSLVVLLCCGSLQCHGKLDVGLFTKYLRSGCAYGSRYTDFTLHVIPLHLHFQKIHTCLVSKYIKYSLRVSMGFIKHRNDTKRELRIS